MSDWRFVCAFRGRRDDYQVPLALSEGGMLAGFITDIYATPRLARLAKGLPRVGPMLEFRRKDGIPAAKVHQSPVMAVREFSVRLDHAQAELLRDRHDDLLSLRAAEVARRERAHLFLYSSNAVPAFEASYRHAPKKILFQYHPHYASEHAILRDDNVRHGRASGAVRARADSVVRPYRLRSDEAWRGADHIVCASSFTARTLIEAGADSSRISVIGYGVALPARRSIPPANDAFRVLFVGSGIQRKGLHHLLQAWTRARLPASAELTIIARTHDVSLIDRGTIPNGVSIVPGLSAAMLVDAYRSASLFCMPSLIEGFGQVYVEALAEGLPVLGTRNTCLPDLGGESDGVFLTEPGDVDALAAQLERLSSLVPGHVALKEAAARTAARCDWGAFRRRIREVCGQVMAAPGGSSI